jgi:signal transduction histidine kinase
MTPPTASDQVWARRWQRLSSVSMQAFHRYANWLVSITWKRFIVLSILLMIVAAIASELPPFSWRVTETIEDTPSRESRGPSPPPPPIPPVPVPAREPGDQDRTACQRRRQDRRPGHLDRRAWHPHHAARQGQLRRRVGRCVAPGGTSGAASTAGEGQVSIKLPPGVDKEAIREAVQDAREAIEEAIQAQREAAQAAKEVAREAREAAREAERDARQAAKEAAEEARAAISGPTGKIKRTRRIRWADFLTDLALMWILASAIIKATYKGRIQAEVKAAQATETAEAESLKRQVVEARMAAMQAQVEPHFLFNTLASIDHLIETDPKRASQMQKNLIALLRASMPTMREANDGGVRDLARELQVIRPYLEILKVRMEERLATRIDVPDGLLSAEFPPMMVQTLVENAIKHGLEPKAEGGQLTVKAEIVHGKLQVSVADTGLGFGRAGTAGTGVGLANIRERLQLLYGPKAALTVAENPGGGTVVTITVPYRSLGADAA